MAWLLLAIGFSYQRNDSARQPLVVTFTLIYVAFYSLGGGPVPFTYSAEAFPLSHREIGMGSAVAVNLFFAGLLALMYPRMNSSLGTAASLGIFCAFNMVAWILIFLFVPETSQCSLEDLDFRFGVPTQRHIKHQTDTIAWYMKRPAQRGGKPSLYFMDEGNASDEMDYTHTNGFGEGRLSTGDVSNPSVHSPEQPNGHAGDEYPDDVSGSSVHRVSEEQRAESRHSNWYIKPGEIGKSRGLAV